MSNHDLCKVIKDKIHVCINIQYLLDYSSVSIRLRSGRYPSRTWTVLLWSLSCTGLFRTSLYFAAFILTSTLTEPLKLRAACHKSSHTLDQFVKTACSRQVYSCATLFLLLNGWFDFDSERCSLDDLDCSFVLVMEVFEDVTHTAVFILW